MWPPSGVAIFLIFVLTLTLTLTITLILILTLNPCCQIIRYLARTAKCDLDAQSISGMTATHFAARYGHVPVVIALVREFGADEDLKDNFGFRAVDYARVRTIPLFSPTSHLSIEIRMYVLTTIRHAMKLITLS